MILYTVTKLVYSSQPQNIYGRPPTETKFLYFLCQYPRERYCNVFTLSVVKFLVVVYSFSQISPVLSIWIPPCLSNTCNIWLENLAMDDEPMTRYRFVLHIGACTVSTLIVFINLSKYPLPPSTTWTGRILIVFSFLWKWD